MGSGFLPHFLFFQLSDMVPGAAARAPYAPLRLPRHCETGVLGVTSLIIRLLLSPLTQQSWEGSVSGSGLRRVKEQQQDSVRRAEVYRQR